MSRVMTKAELEKRQEAKRKKLEAEKEKKEQQRVAAELGRESRSRWAMTLVDRESRAYEEAVVRQREEEARLEREVEEVAVWQKATGDRFKRWTDRKAAATEWKRYIEASWKVDATKPAEVNTFISQWNDVEHPDLQQTLLQSQEAHDICCSLEEVEFEAESSGDTSKATCHQETQHQLRDMISAKVDEATASTINHADKLMNEDEDDVLFVQGSTKDLKLAIWMAYGADPKSVGNLGAIDCPELGMGTVLPSHVVISGAALRLMRLPFILHEATGAKAITDLYALGGELMFDWLGLPPAPKRVKSWTLRPVLSQSHTVNRIPYNPMVGVKDASVSALPVHFAIPTDVVVRNPQAPVVAWFNKDTGTWLEDGMHDAVFDENTRLVKFKAPHPAPFALAQHMDLDIPFESWKITRVAPTRCVFSIVTRAKLEVVIEVSDDTCRLIKPSFDELAGLRSSRLPPKLLLKGEVREKDVYDQISQFVPGFSFCSSKWNHVVSRVSQFAFRVSPEDSPDPQEYMTVLTHPTGCAFTSLPEFAPTFSHDCAHGCEVHAHLQSLLSKSERFSAHLLEDVAKREPHFTRAVLAILSAVRPLGFSPAPVAGQSSPALESSLGPTASAPDSQL
eukprot:m51a1_g1639 hypothetical protein (622) ;mRNA; r:306916-309232